MSRIGHDLEGRNAPEERQDNLLSGHETVTELRDLLYYQAAVTTSQREEPKHEGEGKTDKLRNLSPLPGM